MGGTDKKAKKAKKSARGKKKVATSSSSSKSAAKAAKAAAAAAAAAAAPAAATSSSTTATHAATATATSAAGATTVSKSNAESAPPSSESRISVSLLVPAFDFPPHTSDADIAAYCTRRLGGGSSGGSDSNGAVVVPAATVKAIGDGKRVVALEKSALTLRYIEYLHRQNATMSANLDQAASSLIYMERYATELAKRVSASEAEMMAREMKFRGELRTLKEYKQKYTELNGGKLASAGGGGGGGKKQHGVAAAAALARKASADYTSAGSKGVGRKDLESLASYASVHERRQELVKKAEASANSSPVVERRTTGVKRGKRPGSASFASGGVPALALRSAVDGSGSSPELSPGGSSSDAHSQPVSADRAHSQHSSSEQHTPKSARFSEAFHCNLCETCTGFTAGFANWICVCGHTSIRHVHHDAAMTDEQQRVAGGGGTAVVLK